MVSVTTRLSGLSDNLYGDQEKDANALLMELDKDLRSGKAGVQSEAIVRFPRLFEKYPFPILINSSFLKLADVFRVGTNFLRLCVLQVTRQSDKHVEKITSIDEFVRRIYSVIRSNDPVARALTLRTLGSVACIIAEKKIVHHSIISCLDSRDRIELEGAIFAASLFSAKSKSFAASICGKLLEMIEYLSVPVDMKLKLMSVFQHMNCNVETSQLVRRSCTKLLDNYPAVKFVQNTLHTLTLLSLRSPVDIPQQIELLLQRLLCDSRSAVQLTALADLRLLAVRTPHMWSHSHILGLCELLNEGSRGNSEDIELGVVKIFSTLSSNVAITQMSHELSSPVLELCQRYCYHHNLAIMEQACHMFVDIVIQKERDGELSASDELFYTCCSVLDMSLTVIIDQSTNSNLNKVLLACLKSVLKLCGMFMEAAKHFTDTLAATLAFVSDDVALSVCEFLSAIGCMDGSLLLGLVPDLTVRLKALIMQDCEAKQALLLSLLRLLFQAYAEDGLSDDVVIVVSEVEQHINGWTAYRVARQAARYGHHSLASNLFASLSRMTSKEQTNFWLVAVRDCCAAESSLQGSAEVRRSEFTSRMQRAEASYHTGIVALKAASTPTHPLTFQIDYFSLRVRMIQALLLVVRACGSFQMCPPPAIATSLTIATGLESHRCEHVLIQLKKCCEKLRELESKYQLLYQSSFDADADSLANLDLLLKMCRLMVHVIETVIYPAQRSECIDGGELLNPIPVASSHATDANISSMHNQWSHLRTEVTGLLQNTIRASSSEATLTHQDIECIEKASVLLSRWRHCLPRYIFQRLQTTDIKLAISPAPRLSGEPILIHCDTDLTLKVEGVIQTSAISKRFRHVDNIQLEVGSKLECRANNVLGKLEDNPSNQMVRVVRPHNDYFSAQFLLSFPVAGQHVINVEASVVNYDGMVWHTGPQTAVYVKSSENPIKQHLNQQHQQQQQHHVKFAGI